MAAAMILLVAMFGAGMIVHETAAEAEANVTRSVDLGARLASASPQIASPSAAAESASPAAPPMDAATLAPLRRVVVLGRHHRHRHHRRHANG